MYFKKSPDLGVDLDFCIESPLDGADCRSSGLNANLCFVVQSDVNTSIDVSFLMSKLRKKGTSVWLPLVM